MRPSTPIRRALNPDNLAASLRSSSASSSSSSHPTSPRRELATASAELPIETPELQIFDIFDAPARLGTSPTRLRLPPRSPPSPRPSHAQRPSARLMMPSPVLFDGPSGTPPRSPAASMSSSTTPSAHFADSLPKSLPPPETFDGPARMRGPTAPRLEKKTPWLTTPSFLMLNLLGFSGAAGLFVMS